MLFLQADPIVDATVWKAQLPWFARRHRVVTFDPRGNGRSDRPAESAAYLDAEYAADAMAVLDASETRAVVVIALCQSVAVALLLAAEHPDRILGIVAINPGLALTPPHPHRGLGGFDAPLDRDDGWFKENRHFWRRDWTAYTEFFFDELLPEAHSTKQHEDCVAWAAEAGADVMLAYRDQASGVRHEQAAAEALCARVRCPVRVLVGSDDRCQPPARSSRLVDLTGGELVVFDGAGHLLPARDPVRVNLEIAAFVSRIGPLRSYSAQKS